MTYISQATLLIIHKLSKLPGPRWPQETNSVQTYDAQQPKSKFTICTSAGNKKLIVPLPRSSSAEHE